MGGKNILEHLFGILQIEHGAGPNASIINKVIGKCVRDISGGHLNITRKKQ